LAESIPLVVYVNREDDWQHKVMWFSIWHTCLVISRQRHMGQSS